MINDYSFGIIPVREKDGRFEYLLVRHIKSRHWAFPKGHKEGEESDLEAALRECNEETGLEDIEVLIEQSFIEYYTYTFSGQEINKKVTFYIGNVFDDKEIKIQPEEIEEYIWLPYEEAIKKITFKESRLVLEQANKYLLDQKV